ncbi:geranylgeranyl reductase family protein [Leptolyngbya iicbica]|uniref:geranylgeranyl reductase family protein n=1 Tax=Leptolyngbya iicbica TaxID=3161580 RepID=UPI000584BB29|nr:geranylgeranyl reductase family protein [Leptolyngbya sp. LK]
MTQYDCVIVGAGPAGSSTAYHLARQGATVLLLEQAALPRPKPCTGALSPRVAEWFDFDFAPALANTVRQVRYTWKLGDEIISELETQEPIWIVRRDTFDQFLAEQAIAQGATLHDQTPVAGVEQVDGRWHIHTSRGTYQARYLVAADGATGPMSGWLGLESAKPRAAAVLELPTPLPPDKAALNFEFGLLKSGCLWCFPRDRDTVMGGVTLLGKQTPNFEQTFATYAQDFDLTGGDCQVHPVRLWDGHRKLHTQQALVVGEAAAIVDPLSAEGIRHGMYSGMKAAEAIAAALAGEPDALAGYTAAMHEWGDNMQWAQRIASVFFRVPGLGYRVGIKRPTMTKRMGQLLAGEIQYSDIANRIIKRLTTGFIPGRS